MLVDSLDKKIMKKTLTELNRAYQKGGTLALYGKTTNFENEWISNSDFRNHYKKIQLFEVSKKKISTKKTCKKKISRYTTSSATKAH